MKRYLAILIAAIMLLGMAPALAEAPTEIPREETLTFNGIQWGTPPTFNPFVLSNVAFPTGGSNERFLVYEALYMYNMLTNENEPLLADGPIEWEDEYNILVKLKDNVHWNDGEPFTADDVVFTYNVANDGGDGFYTSWSQCWTYLDKIEKVDDYTVRFTVKEEPYNMHIMPSLMAITRIMPEHVWAPRVAEGGDDGGEHVRSFFNEDAVGTGPYKVFFYDETRVVGIRDDNYWGQAENMFGKIPDPKYVAHPIYQDNAAGNLGFSQGEVDISQQFLPSVWELQETMDAPVTTFYDGPPYHQGAGMPSLVFNLTKPGLDDYAVRKAIALCLDYEAIGVNAMSGYTEPIVYCFYNAYLFEDYIDFDDEELQDLMWDTTDLDANLAEANRLLDEAGYADVDGDGYRELPDGTKFEWQAECPYGWSDWNASLEILVESAKNIGLNIVTYFPEASVYNVDLQTGNFDIVMNSPYPTLSVAMPWQAGFNVLYGEGIPPIGEVTTRNYNRYNNERVNELVNLSASTNDMDELVEYFTEINKIWLEELPTVLLMYRPQYFHTTYEGYWTGFASKDDGTNTPPYLCIDGAGYKNLFTITSVK